MTAAVEFDNVDILFPRIAVASARRAMQPRWRCSTQGENRDEIQTATGVVVGVGDASLPVEHGQISVLMGLSGSGKSTLLRAANGLNRRHARSGARAATASGRSTWRAAMRRRCGACGAARIAMMFQQFGLLPWRTVRENVGFGLELRGEPAAERKRIVDEKLELVGLVAVGRSLRSRAVGRHAAARRAGARVCDRCRHPADGRAVLGARPVDPQQAAGRAARAAGARAEDHPVRHA